MSDLPASFPELLDVATREPDRLRQRLAESPPDAERVRIESALSGAEAMRRDDRAIRDELGRPERLHARLKFWRELDPKGLLQ